MAADEATSNILASLQRLGIKEPAVDYPTCHPEINPFDVYRAHLTDLLHDVTGVDASIIYPVLQWTQSLDKGDLVLPIPALRLKGKKPNELGEEWVAKVSRAGTRSCYNVPCTYQALNLMPSLP